MIKKTCCYSMCAEVHKSTFWTIIYSATQENNNVLKYYNNKHHVGRGGGGESKYIYKCIYGDKKLLDIYDLSGEEWIIYTG